jgi:hypothetical protein
VKTFTIPLPGDLTSREVPPRRDLLLYRAASLRQHLHPRPTVSPPDTQPQAHHDKPPQPEPIQPADAAPPRARRGIPISPELGVPTRAEPGVPLPQSPASRPAQRSEPHQVELPGSACTDRQAVPPRSPSPQAQAVPAGGPFGDYYLSAGTPPAPDCPLPRSATVTDQATPRTGLPSPASPRPTTLALPATRRARFSLGRRITVRAARGRTGVPSERSTPEGAGLSSRGPGSPSDVPARRCGVVP